MRPKLAFRTDDFLVLIGIFKILPWGWFKILPKYYDFNYGALRAKVHNSKKAGYLTIEEDREHLEYLVLTKKGVDRVKQIIPLSYEFRPWKGYRSDTIHRSHHRIIFHFLLDWINYFSDEPDPSGLKGRPRITKKVLAGDFSKYNIEAVYTDYEPDLCRFAFKYSGYEIDLRPDMILKPSKEANEVLICLEADTGSMSISLLYNKILRYCMLAHANFNYQGVQKIKLYFSFQSIRRAETVFKFPKVLNSNGLIYELFNQGLVQKYINAKSKASIRTVDLIKVLKEEKIELYSGLERMGFENFQKVDLLGNILEVCDRVRVLDTK